MKRITKDARHVQFVNLSAEKGSKANINSKEIKHDGMSDLFEGINGVYTQFSN